MNDKDIEGIRSFLDHFMKTTVRIITYNSEGNLIGMRSGFIYQPDPVYLPIVITAGHDVPSKGSFIETSITKDGKVLTINAGTFKIFYSYHKIDYAYSYLLLKLIRNSLTEKKGNAKIEYFAYRNKFYKATKKEVYGFAVLNNHEIVEREGIFTLPRYQCFEVGMKLIKKNDHINYFKTANELKEDEYYEGASGSPIADTGGKINSILIGRTESKEHLEGFRLDNIDIPTNIPI